MSIIDTFDNETEAMIHLEDVCQKSTIQLDVCIINFSYKIMQALSLIHISEPTRH